MDTNLILIDHDGTLCHTNELAYESIRYTAQKTCQDFQINPQQILLDLDGIIADLTGTTEKKISSNHYWQSRCKQRKCQ